MQRGVLATRVLLLGAALAGCSTEFQIQVPQSDIEHFAACVEDPTTSYSRPTSATKFESLGYSVTKVRSLAGGENHFFVTNDELGPSAPAVKDEWTDRALAAYGFTDKEKEKGSAELTAVADEVDRVWSHPVHQTFLTAYNQLATNSGQTQPTIKASDLRDYIKMVRSVTAKNGWSVYALRSAKRLMVMTDSADPKQRQSELQKFKAGVFIATYLEAYFRNGQFVQLKYDLGNPLQDIEKLANYSSDADKKKIANILDKFRKAAPDAEAQFEAIIKKDVTGTIGKVATTALITRGGDSLAMPAVTVSAGTDNSKIVSVSKLDTNAIIEDVVRVTFEALFDSINEVPAVTNATGVKLPAEYAAAELPDFAKVTSAYDQNKGKPPMSADDFAKVDSDGGKIHAMTATAVANLIRGVNVAALNNEAIANTLTSMAATTGRKVTERVTWCYYAAVNASSATKPALFYSNPLKEKTITFKLSY